MTHLPNPDSKSTQWSTPHKNAIQLRAKKIFVDKYASLFFETLYSDFSFVRGESTKVAEEYTRVLKDYVKSLDEFFTDTVKSKEA